MQRIVTSINQRCQVTIPAAVRRRLGLGPGDKVAFEIERGEVRLLPVTFTLESAYGSVEPLHRPEDFKALSRRAKEEHSGPCYTDSDRVPDVKRIEP
jgi:AbrB family looped-hinge helix DNA binding protein